MLISKFICLLLHYKSKHIYLLLQVVSKPLSLLKAVIFFAMKRLIAYQAQRKIQLHLLVTQKSHLPYRVLQALSLFNLKSIKPD